MNGEFWLSFHINTIYRLLFHYFSFFVFLLHTIFAASVFSERTAHKHHRTIRAVGKHYPLGCRALAVCVQLVYRLARPGVYRPTLGVWPCVQRALYDRIGERAAACGLYGWPVRASVYGGRRYGPPNAMVEL